MTWPLSPTRAFAGLFEMRIVNWPAGSWPEPGTIALALPLSPAATLYLIECTPDLTAVTFHTNVRVWPGRRAPSAHVLVYAVTPPCGPVSSTHTGRDGSARPASLLASSNAAAAAGALAS